MDDFGVLVKGYGIKPQGKSAPMAASKQPSSSSSSTTKPHNYNNTNTNTINIDLDPSFGTRPFSHNSISGTGSFFDDRNDDIFGFSSMNRAKSYASTTDVLDATFTTMPGKSSSFSSFEGVGVDIESMFKGSMNLNSNSNSNSNGSGGGVDDDLIWGFSGKGSSNVVVGSDDLLSSDPVDDFLGKLGMPGSGLGSDRAGSKGVKVGGYKANVVDTDELLPGFGSSNNGVNDRAQAASTEKSAGSSSLEELEDFVAGKTIKSAKGHINGSSVKKEGKKTVSKQSLETNFIDIEGSLNGDIAHYDKVENMSESMFSDGAPDLDSFFSAHTKRSVPVGGDTSTNMKVNEVPDIFSEATVRKEKKVSPTHFPDDLTSMFGGFPTSGVFEEVEGESDERRRLRLERHQKATARMEQALADLNQREYQAQQEQEERHRIAEAMEMEMKRWAAGKEGNLRALLSSLQQVLAPELGWRPVTLTDLITSSQVKFVYKKAALCVHPDKVQQKGASLQQKYVAEKVFDLLKEAWNKFNTEELR